MAPTECPRCVSARQTSWAVTALVFSGASTLFAGGVTCCSLAVGAVLQATDYPDPQLRSRGLSMLPASTVLVVLTIALLVLVRHLVRRDETPLPAPATDPLAHYREGGPLECPRHPFAR